jgi:hypothetical protein
MQKKFDIMKGAFCFRTLPLRARHCCDGSGLYVRCFFKWIVVGVILTVYLEEGKYKRDEGEKRVKEKR